MSHDAGSPAAQELTNHVRVRLERAGQRFKAAEREKKAALTELHGAVREADGQLSATSAAELTGLPSVLLLTMQPELATDQRD